MYVMEDGAVNLIAGWTGFLGGILAGAAAGLHFYKETWLGGYGSFRRRMIRLAHISFFGIGLINILFTLSLPMLHPGALAAVIASVSFIIAMVSMPLCCYLAAWKMPLRHLFPIPVVSLGTGVTSLLFGSVL
jgi:hypothetical protein